jgi:hypothetical protein
MEQNTNVLCGLTWNQYLNMPPAEGDNPNNYKNINVLRKWIPYAEYYNQDSMPYITYFDSFNHFSEKILKNEIDFNDISTKMNVHNKIKKEKIYEAWKEIIKNL